MLYGSDKIAPGYTEWLLYKEMNERIFRKENDLVVLGKNAAGCGAPYTGPPLPCVEVRARIQAERLQDASDRHAREEIRIHDGARWCADIAEERQVLSERSR